MTGNVPSFVVRCVFVLSCGLLLTTSLHAQIELDGDPCSPDPDGDGIPTLSDNCPTLYNPGQAGTPSRGDVCNSLVDIDGDGVVEANDNCPNHTSIFLENGVPRPPLQQTYNPGQSDSDGDAIGDRCECREYCVTGEGTGIAYSWGVDNAPPAGIGPPDTAKVLNVPGT